MKKIVGFIKKYVPVWVMVSFAITLLSVLTLTIAVNFAPFADFVNTTVAVAVRATLSAVTLLLPLSVFEILLILLLPLLVLIIVLAVRRGRDARSRLRTVFSLLGLIGLFCSSYVFTLGVGYHTTDIADKLGIVEDTDITAEELYDVASLLRDEVNSLSERIGFADGESRMGYSVTELSRKLVGSFDKVREEHPFFVNFFSRVKPVMSSTVMSDAGITGIYSFFTGEANVNIDYPDYYLPFTAAHELSHQRGISRENEANFMAFLVCINSDDDYIRYSGYLYMYEYISSALYRTDKELYYELRDSLSQVARSDISAAAAVSLAHKDSLLGKINDILNDTYLKANGTAGVVSYGYVVRLTVGYYSE